MKTKFTWAAMLYVGWFLMIPPDSTRNWAIRHWTHVQSFDTAEQCETTMSQRQEVVRKTWADNIGKDSPEMSSFMLDIVGYIFSLAWRPLYSGRLNAAKLGTM